MTPAPRTPPPRPGPPPPDAAPAGPRILIVRLSALGDVILASGLIPALRARHAGATLHWLVEPPAAPLLQGHPRLDRLIVWPRSSWRALARAGRWGELWRAFRALRATLREGRYDLVLDTQGLLKSAFWSWLSGAPRRISLIGWEGSHHLATERFVPDNAPQGRPFGAEYRALARHLGAPEGSFQPDLHLGPAARAAAATALVQAGLPPGQAYAVLCPWTTRPQKHWFEAEWQALGARLVAAGLVPVVLGGPADAQASAQLLASLPQGLSLAGKLPLDASLAAIAEARLLVGVDTGLTHAGTALGVPTVALWGSTRPYLDPGRPGTRVLYSARACSPCRRHPTCGGRFDCMRDHMAESVWAEAQALLAQAALSPPAAPRPSPAA